MRDETNIQHADLTLRIGVEGIGTARRSLTHAGQ
jgi:hypothetical protein